MTAAKLRNGAVTSTKLGARSVTDGDLANSSLTIDPRTGLTGGGAVSLGGRNLRRW